jgi:hypothetical protein
VKTDPEQRIQGGRRRLPILVGLLCAKPLIGSVGCLASLEQLPNQSCGSQGPAARGEGVGREDAFGCRYHVRSKTLRLYQAMRDRLQQILDREGRNVRKQIDMAWDVRGRRGNSKRRYSRPALDDPFLTLRKIGAMAPCALAKVPGMSHLADEGTATGPNLGIASFTRWGHVVGRVCCCCIWI